MHTELTRKLPLRAVAKKLRTRDQPRLCGWVAYCWTPVHRLIAVLVLRASAHHVASTAFLEWLIREFRTTDIWPLTNDGSLGLWPWALR